MASPAKLLRAGWGVISNKTGRMPLYYSEHLVAVAGDPPSLAVFETKREARLWRERRNYRKNCRIVRIWVEPARG